LLATFVAVEAGKDLVAMRHSTHACRQWEGVYKESGRLAYSQAFVITEYSLINSGLLKCGYGDTECGESIFTDWSSAVDGGRIGIRVPVRPILLPPAYSSGFALTVPSGFNFGVPSR
jgi:hypothetical protein